MKKSAAPPKLKGKQEEPIEIHLHWTRSQPSKWVDLQEISAGIAICGVKNLPRGMFVLDDKKATCERCLELAKRTPAEMQPLFSKTTPKPLSVPSQKKVPLQTPPDGYIVTLVKHNPRKVGTGKFERMALLLKFDGKSVAEFAAAGGNLETLKNAVTEGLVEVRSKGGQDG